MTDVLTARIGKAGTITLNRPAALNALTLPMVQQIQIALDNFTRDPVVEQIVISSSSEKAFCAGGDVRAVTEHRDHLELGAEFFRAEYRLNYAIAHCPKLVIALVDGICMGGGLGLSVHAAHCVASERAIFAMPEMAIGLFPDVGGGYFLNKCPGETGIWLALTGARLSGADAVYAGLAHDFVPSEKLPELRQTLSRMEGEEALYQFVQPPRVQALATQEANIDAAFSHESMEDIIRHLDGQGDDWANTQLKALATGCPTSQKLTLEHIRTCRGKTLREVLSEEYRMACACLRGHDFYEGVRARLIDKDHDPRWQPATLREVTPHHLAAFEAAPIGPELFAE